METYIYFEKQEGALCGVHCLNNLLQSAYFTPVDLASIARDLDKQERALGLYAPGLESGATYTHENGETSANMDESGNFSIQVLRNAISKSHQIQLTSWSGSDDRSIDPLDEIAFIINRSDHWFAIRKINDRYWNLNSTLNVPEEVTPFYLSAFLSQLRSDGYIVFIARGNIPSKGRKPIDGIRTLGVWYKEEALIAGKAAAVDKKFTAFQGKGRSLGGSSSSDDAGMQEDELIDALKMSMENDSDYKDDPELALALALSRAIDAGVVVSGVGSGSLEVQESEADKKKRIREARLKALG